MKVLIVNPGATSTKIAVFEEEKELFKVGIDHSAEELNRFERIIDQADFRREAILEAITAAGYQLSDFDAVCGRGGLYRPIPSGTYAVNDIMVKDCTIGVQGQHASNLGGLIAREIGDELGIPSYIVDPVVVDEMADVARYAGHPLFQRMSIFHALNQKAVAKRFAKENGKHYEDLNLIVCHMGGGCSIGAHVKGSVVDTQNALDGEGPFSPERSGSLPTGQLVKQCFSDGREGAGIEALLTQRPHHQVAAPILLGRDAVELGDIFRTVAQGLVEEHLLIFKNADLGGSGAGVDDKDLVGHIAVPPEKY